MEKYAKLLKKYSRVIKYIIFGALTTVVNIVTYYLLTKQVGIEEIASSAIAWIISVIFAYVTNKIYVFKSKTKKAKELIKELTKFFSSRIFTGLLCDICIFAFMVKILDTNDVTAKVLVQVLVVVLNYLISKKCVFKGKKTK